MSRIFFSVLIVVILSGVAFQSCKEVKEGYNIGAAEDLLLQAKISSKDSMRYVLWGNVSSGDARKYSAQLLKELEGRNIKYILDSNFIQEQGISSLKNVIVDSHYVFTTDNPARSIVQNIGIINVYNNNVLDITDYKPGQMEQFKADLLK